MSEKKDIGNVLKSAMEGYAATPDDLWPAIESKLKRQKRTRLLWWLLLLAGIMITAVIVYNISDKDSSITDTNNNSIPLKNKDQKNPLETETTKKLISSDSLSTEIPEKDADSENKPLQQKLKSVKRYKVTNGGQKNSTDNHTNINNDDSKTEIIKRNRSPYNHLLIMLEVKELGQLQLVVDSLQFMRTIAPVKEARTERTWRFSSFASLDHYNAFGRSTSNQNTFNYGAYLYFYATDYTALRIGFKKVDFQYNFLDRNDASQQQVSYLEVPLEVRSFFSKGKSFKTSFIGGASFLMTQDATLIDFDNNSILDNEDIFTTSSFSINAGFGLHYDLNSKWRLSLESVFKYHVQPFSRNRSYNPYNLSLSFGIEYGF